MTQSADTRTPDERAQHRALTAELVDDIYTLPPSARAAFIRFVYDTIERRRVGLPLDDNPII